MESVVTMTMTITTGRKEIARSVMSGAMMMIAMVIPTACAGDAGAGVGSGGGVTIARTEMTGIISS